MIFRVEVVCLNFVFVGDEVCLQSMECCFDSGVACDTHVSSPVTTRLKKVSPSSLYRVRKSNALVCRINLCSSVSIFGTQRVHSFRNLNFMEAIPLCDNIRYIYLRPDKKIIYNISTTINSAWLHVSAVHAAIFRPALDRTSTLMCPQYGIPCCLHV